MEIIAAASPNFMNIAPPYNALEKAGGQNL